MVFQVGGTKKGGMPVTTEKRPRGKTVTVIGNVKGDKDELIRLLKSSLGCGGHAIGHDRVEIQGDHASAIQDLLLKHGGSGAMKGVAGLKPPRPPARRTDETSAEEEKASRAEKVEAREDARRRRARESRQRSLKEAVLVKPESTRAFHAFAAMMKRWRYWDQDYDRLHEMHHRHLRELDENDKRGNDKCAVSALGASFLDADDSFLDDNERMQGGEKPSAVLETMRENLDDLNHHRVTASYDPASAERSSAYEQLRALGMIAEPSPFRQTREERLAESRRNAAEVKARALNEARVLNARRKEKENDARRSAVGSISNAVRGTRHAGFAGRVVVGGGSGGVRSSRPGGASAKRGKGDASRPTLGFTAARKRGGLSLLYHDDDEEEDEETRSGSEDDGTAADTTAAASWDSTPGFRRDDGGGFSFGPVAGAGATPAWAREAVGDGDETPQAGSLSLEELDLREALRQSLLEAERATRRVGLHVECGDVWGELTEEEALALAMELSEQDERRRLREEREAYEAYEVGAYEAGAYSRDGSEDDFEEARGAYAEETPNEFPEFSAASSSDADADLAEALRLSALESERERLRALENRARGDALMPETMDEDAALREALRLSALESESEANRESARGSAPVSPRGAKETACQWAAAHLGAFTGESDNSVLAEYVVSMSRAEVEGFLGESFGDAEAAEAFARALEEMR